jgi:hypothetical protein
MEHREASRYHGINVAAIPHGILSPARFFPSLHLGKASRMA